MSDELAVSLQRTVKAQGGGGIIEVADNSFVQLGEDCEYLRVSQDDDDRERGIRHLLH